MAFQDCFTQKSSTITFHNLLTTTSTMPLFSFQTKRSPKMKTQPNHAIRALLLEAMADPELLSRVEEMAASVSQSQQSSASMESSDAAHERSVPPARDEAIVNLPFARLHNHNRTNLKNANDSCGICYEPLSQGFGVSRLPCGHVFHIQCSSKWLSHTCTCPECRYELPTNDPEYEKERVERMSRRTTVECSCRPSNHDCFFALKESGSSCESENESLVQSMDICKPVNPPNAREGQQLVAY